MTPKLSQNDEESTFSNFENNNSKICFAFAESSTNFSASFLDFGAESHHEFQIEPFTNGGSLSYKQILLNVGRVGEIFFSVPRMSFSFPGLHWNLGSVYVSGLGRSASFTFGFHVRQPFVKSISPSSGIAGTKITIVLENIFNSKLGELMALEIPFFREKCFSAQMGNFVISTTQIEVADAFGVSTSLSLVVPDLGYHSDTTVLVIIWSPLLGSGATTHFEYKVSVEYPANSTVRIANESQADRQNIGIDGMREANANFEQGATNSPVSTMSPCVASQFCLARGLAANPKQNAESGLCDTGRMCLSPSAVTALALRPLGVRPKHIVDGITVVTAAFTNCFATVVGQVKITRINDDVDVYLELLPVTILGLTTRPGRESGSEPSSPWECEISFQPPPLSKNFSCEEKKFRLTIHLGAVTSQSTEFSLSYVSRFINTAKIEHPPNIYQGAADSVIIRLFHGAAYMLPRVEISIPEVATHNVNVVVGDCLDLFVTVEVDLAHSDVVSDSLKIFIVAIYDQNEENNISAIEFVSAPETIMNRSSGVIAIQTLLELPILSKPVLVLQHPMSIPSNSGGIMIFQVRGSVHILWRERQNNISETLTIAGERD